MLLHDLREGLGHWRRHVRLQRPDEKLFYRNWTFVTEVRLDGAQLVVTARVGTGDYPYSLYYRTPKRDQRTVEGTLSSSNPNIRIRLFSAQPKLYIRLHIADCLAYEGYVSQQSIFQRM